MKTITDSFPVVEEQIGTQNEKCTVKILLILEA